MLSGYFVHKNVISRLWQPRYAKDIPKAINDPLYAWWSINMQIGSTRIASRPRTSMQKRNEIRNMVWMKMRHNDTVQLIMLNTNLKKSLNHSMPTIEKHWHTIQLYQHT